jgi:amino acid transporter
MIGLLALTVVAVVTALALRRVREERLIAAVYMYAPYWEYLVPVAFFALALLPNGKKKKKSRYTRREVVTV